MGVSNKRRDFRRLLTLQLDRHLANGTVLDHRDAKRE